MRNDMQKGAALIAVLCFILLVNVLIASSVSLSQLVNYTSKETTQRGASAYLVEGAAARAIWLLVNDKKKYPERSLGETDYANAEEERYLADGTEHKFESDGAEVTVRIFDMGSGSSIAGKTPSSKLQRTQSDCGDDEKAYEDYKDFLDKVDDYVDSDPFVRLHGAEKNEYLTLKMPPLPRNGDFIFREEVLWIPGCSQFFKPDEYGMVWDFQIIPLKGLPKIIGKDNFFSVSKGQIMSDLGLNQSDTEKVIRARDEWAKNGMSLSTSLGEELFNRLKGEYSFKESGFYTFVVKVRPEKGRSERVLTFSLKLESRIQGDIFNYYDWRIF